MSLNYNPHAQLHLAGAWLRCDPAVDDHGRTVFAADEPTLVGEASVTWGRRDQWRQPPPSVCTLAFFDPTGAWLSRVQNRTAAGQVLWWMYYRPDVEAPDDDSRVIFQGFTTNVDVEKTRQRTTDGMSDGWMVQVQAVDRSGVLGNIRWSTQTWPAETMLDRAIRIRDAAAPAGIREFYFNQNHKTGTVGPLEVRDKTNLDSTNAMYRSFAEPWTYVHQRNVVTRITEKTTNDGAFFVLLPSSDKVTIAAPSIIDNTGQEDPIDRLGYPGATIDGALFSAPVALSSSALTDITRVECKWHIKQNGHTPITTVVEPDPPPSPPRALSYESWFDDGLTIDPIIQQAYAKSQGYGALPPHPDLVIDTRYTGGFDSIDLFESLAHASETVRVLFVTGSPFTAALGTAPMYSPQGGTIAYRDGHWKITTSLAAHDGPPPADPITWETMRDEMRWKDGESVSGRTFTDSVSWYDLGWIDNPLIYAQQ